MQYYLSKDYLLTPATGDFTKYFLYLSLIILTLCIGARIYIAFAKRLELFKSFDRFWFFGFSFSALVGLFIYFSRTQALPAFSTRFVSYSWILLNLSFFVFLFVYYRKTIPEKVEQFYAKKRKQKYLQ